MSDVMLVAPGCYREMVVAMAKAGLIDRWDAWRDLFNAGWRGQSLNGWL